jgi:hypothetical protein
LRNFSPLHCDERPLSVLTIVSNFTALVDNVGDRFKNDAVSIISCAPNDRENSSNVFAKFAFANAFAKFAFASENRCYFEIASQIPTLGLI